MQRYNACSIQKAGEIPRDGLNSIRHLMNSELICAVDTALSTFYFAPSVGNDRDHRYHMGHEPSALYSQLLHISLAVPGC